MKTWTSILLVALVGLFAAVGASGPTDPPNSALKKVTHDATLTGDGTTALPLGIANGAVTAPKIAAAAPSAGQLLSFNGTGLAWQSPAAGAVRVVDSLGRDVGPLIGEAFALRRMGAFTFRLAVNQNGFANQTIPFLHTSLDCSGPRYHEAPTRLIPSSWNTSTQVFFAAEPIQQLRFFSQENAQDPSQPGTCDGIGGGYLTPAGLATSMSLSALGLTPPFHLEF